jgi:hypothetical protein
VPENQAEIDNNFGATWHPIVFEGMRINRETPEFIGEDSKRTDSFCRQSHRGDPSQPQV